ncbi:3D domain-containing protein [Alkalibacillus aidingensis]|uniref:3D domain-containing protein n=1 Tax=Alkalibacillus aidingensis TaxID=2747607 RepID=UPI0016612DCB
MKRAIVAIIGVILVSTLLLFAFNNDIKEANTHKPLVTDEAHLDGQSSTLPTISSNLVAKDEIKLIEPEPEVTQTAEQSPSSQEAEVQQVSNQEPVKETMYVTATAYTANCDGCSGTTYTGIDLNKNPDQKVIAVDPDVIPLGSTVWVEGYGTAVAGDIGGAIQGDRIDVFIPSEEEAKRYGVKQVKIEILD